MDIAEESSRAPLRAHILASINPFQVQGDSATRSRGSASHGRTDDRGRSERQRPRHASRRPDNDTEAREDGDTRPRPRPMRWKTKPSENKTRNAKDSFDEQYDRYDSQRRSQGYESDSDKGHSAASQRGAAERCARGEDKDKDKDEQRERQKKDDNDQKEEKESREQTNAERSRRHHHRKRRHHHGRHRTGERVREKRSRSPSRSRSAASDDSRRDKRRRRRHRTHDTEEEDPYADPPLDPDAAFRQSLFDAMADDEGAAYWEAVYGQPVHEYAREATTRQQQQQSANDPDGLAAMNDEEYADYVRRRMWERSQEGRREARENQKRQQAAEAAAEKERVRAKMRAFDQERRHWAAVERSLRRGEARRQRKRWQDRWQAYATAWTAWEASPSPATIPWPVERPATETSGDGGNSSGGKLTEEDFAKQVRAFFTGGPQDDSDASDDTAKPTTEAGLLARLRDERVRWHPDKMQQRLGGSVDAVVMRDITAVFQAVDRLWGELRGKK